MNAESEWSEIIESLRALGERVTIRFRGPHGADGPTREQRKQGRKLRRKARRMRRKGYKMIFGRWYKKK